MKDRSLFRISADSGFFGQTALIDHILQVATEAVHPSPNIILRGRRWIGKTEVLRRVHRELFWSHAAVVPVYYQFKDFSLAEEFAEDYVKEVVKQHLGFVTRDRELVTSQVPLGRLKTALLDKGLDAAAGIITRHMEARKDSDITAMLRNALGAPGCITEASATPVFLMLDDLDHAARLALYSGGPGVLKEIAPVLNASPAPFIVSITGPSEIEGLLSGGHTETIEMSGITGEQSVAMMSEACREYGLDYDSETLALAAKKLDGNPMYIRNILWAAHMKGAPGTMTGIEELADLYVREVSEGSIGAALASTMPFAGLNDLRVLNAAMGSAGHLSLEALSERFDLPRGELAGILKRLEVRGLVETNLGSVKWTGDNVTRDYVSFVYATEVREMSPEEARTWMVRDILKEGFTSRAQKISVRFKEGVVETLKTFRGQRVPRYLFRNTAFQESASGGKRAGLKGEKVEEMTLPFMTGSFAATDVEKNESGPPIVVAHGFQNRRYDSGSEVIWIAGVKESTTPVNLGDVENFLRRSRILARTYQPARVTRWMVGREGFTGEALDQLNRNGILSTDYAGLEILKKGAVVKPGAKAALLPEKEFEVVLPASKNSELVAARAATEISAEMGFDEASIGRIKASVVEACINAIEHGGTAAAKVHLRFVVAPARLTIYISNPGMDFEARPVAGPLPRPGALPRKRGWGMKLMKGFMDEVSFEKIDGGARIVLVKYLIKK